MAADVDGAVLPLAVEIPRTVGHPGTVLAGALVVGVDSVDPNHHPVPAGARGVWLRGGGWPCRRARVTQPHRPAVELEHRSVRICARQRSVKPNAAPNQPIAAATSS